MEVQFNTKEDKNIFTKHSTNPVIPRVGERLFFDDVLYQVTQVFHWFDTSVPREYVEIEIELV